MTLLKLQERGDPGLDDKVFENPGEYREAAADRAPKTRVWSPARPGTLGARSHCACTLLFRANLESVDEIRAMFAVMEQRERRPDGLVNNAAHFTRIPGLEVTEDDWHFRHSVKLEATNFVTGQVLQVDGGLGQKWRYAYAN